MAQDATNRLETIALRTAFGVGQGARVAWYMGQGMAMRQLRRLAQSENSAEPGSKAQAGSGPGREKMLADVRALFLKDLANIENGIYPIPAGEDGSIAARLDAMTRFFADLPNVHFRRQANRHSEVLSSKTKGKRPRYYLQNFHYQTDGWMSDDSARIYDTQVEVLFNGTAAAMRRQVLVPLARHVRGRNQRELLCVDIGCGTGRLLQTIGRAFPRLSAVGVDMSDAYIRQARAGLDDRRRITLMVGKAEELAFGDASVDCVTSTFLFHELPPKIRKQAAGEIARILKPGGKFMLLDSLQVGDSPAYDSVLDQFPQNFHEPYYAGYIREDLAALFASHGLKQIANEPVFVSKLAAFEKSAT